MNLERKLILAGVILIIFGSALILVASQKLDAISETVGGVVSECNSFYERQFREVCGTYYLVETPVLNFTQN
jgi:preprotein translocase subunit SecY